MSTAPPDLSVIVLCYRAEQSILNVLEPLDALLRDADVAFELVLVANYWPGRGDTTSDIVRGWADSRRYTHVIAREKHGAMGWDMRSGLEVARGEVLVVIDGDEQNPVEDVLRMYGLLLQNGADVMKGRRIKRDDGLYRGVISVGYNVLFRLMFGTRGLWDINGKPKAMLRSGYERMTLTSDDWFIDAEIILAARKLGLRIEEMPVSFRENKNRSSFVRFEAIWEFAQNMWRHRFGRSPK